MSIFFTADTHFWHFSIISLCGRPVVEGTWEGNVPGWMSREEACIAMNNLLIQRWNSVVEKDDQVYHLGDFAFAGTAKGQQIFERLNGRKFLIRGNHDGNSQRKQSWEWVKDYYQLKEQMSYETDEGEIKHYVQSIVLFHYPILSWDGIHHGAWHLHGHCHGSLPDTGGLRLDVGVDCNNWYPISLEEIQQKMSLRSVVPAGDHHKVKTGKK